MAGVPRCHGRRRRAMQTLKAFSLARCPPMPAGPPQHPPPCCANLKQVLGTTTWRVPTEIPPNTIKTLPHLFRPPNPFSTLPSHCTSHPTGSVLLAGVLFPHVVLLSQHCPPPSPALHSHARRIAELLRNVRLGPMSLTCNRGC